MTMVDHACCAPPDQWVGLGWYVLPPGFRCSPYFLGLSNVGTVPFHHEASQAPFDWGRALGSHPVFFYFLVFVVAVL